MSYASWRCLQGGGEHSRAYTFWNKTSRQPEVTGPIHPVLSLSLMSSSSSSNSGISTGMMYFPHCTACSNSRLHFLLHKAARQHQACLCACRLAHVSCEGQWHTSISVHIPPGQGPTRHHLTHLLQYASDNRTRKMLHSLMARSV